MQSHEGVEDNLRFLIREVRKQVVRCQRYMEGPTESLRKSLEGRDNYIDNLRTFIQRACFAHAGEDREFYRATDIIAVNLERMADFCEDVADQMQYVRHPDVITPERIAPFTEEVLRGIDLIEEAVVKLDVHQALSICRAEATLDDYYETEFKRCLEELRHARAVETHVTLLFIWHYFERMGDSLLNIGEAVISAALGEKVKIGQVWALEDTIEDLKQPRNLDEIALQAVGESKSGCRIIRVSDRDRTRTGTSVIFKEGARDKLLEEKHGIELWESHVPGVAPKVFSFQDHGPSSAILIEFFSGRTFEQTLLEGTADELNVAFETLTSTLTEIWNGTRTDESIPSRFSAQLRRRMGDVYAIHPDFAASPGSIGDLDLPAFDALVDQAAKLEDGLRAPFGVLNHGDFNMDNVIFSNDDGAARFIDLHRAGFGDYVQDVSVFLVSNHRLQVFDSPVRRRIGQVTRAFHRFAAAYAASVGDSTFEQRLAFGLARSFATSTRFILNTRFAEELFMRSRYLLEQLVHGNLSAPDIANLSARVLRD